ncbi:MAG: cytochrome c [Bryobacteraceae bacterium]|nr:cytochrome c [Bryobacteraceae bacterium]
MAALLSGCRQDMHDQPRYDAQEPGPFFKDGRSARPFVEGTIARGHLPDAPVEGFPDTIPVPVNRQLLQRGRERYDISCSPCHARTGDGNGMIVQRGFRAPPSLHNARSRALPASYIYAVITDGYGAMPSYYDQISPADRWAIVAYTRVLQYSRAPSGKAE